MVEEYCLCRTICLQFKMIYDRFRITSIQTDFSFTFENGIAYSVLYIKQKNMHYV